jgi:hypothetical protein
VLIRNAGRSFEIVDASTVRGLAGLYRSLADAHVNARHLLELRASTIK